MQRDVDWSCFTGPHGPGGVVACTFGDGPVWRAWGTGEPGGQALAPESPFYAGSIAKQFTAACIVSLVLDGVDSLTSSQAGLIINSFDLCGGSPTCRCLPGSAALGPVTVSASIIPFGSPGGDDVRWSDRRGSQPGSSVRAVLADGGSSGYA